MIHFTFTPACSKTRVAMFSACANKPNGAPASLWTATLTEFIEELEGLASIADSVRKLETLTKG
ncbi:MAG TPA: hypothetical protein VNO32_33935 [Candidatus Acidoferrum sp.]|nr:hypothetical protein [Candidatus Acidoferrum sp.]